MPFYVQCNNGPLSCVEIEDGRAAPNHSRQFGPYKNPISVGEYKVSPAIAERIAKGDKSVFTLPMEEVFEQRPVDPGRAFNRKYDMRQVLAALANPEKHPELVADAAKVTEYFDAAEAEELAQKG